MDVQTQISEVELGFVDTSSVSSDIERSDSLALPCGTEVVVKNTFLSFKAPRMCVNRDNKRRFPAPTSSCTLASSGDDDIEVRRRKSTGDLWRITRENDESSMQSSSWGSNISILHQVSQRTTTTNFKWSDVTDDEDDFCISSMPSTSVCPCSGASSQSPVGSSSMPTPPASPSCALYASVGSRHHGDKQVGCKPCRFFQRQGCENGSACTFCHLCSISESKAISKSKKDATRAQVKEERIQRAMLAKAMVRKSK